MPLINNYYGNVSTPQLCKQVDNFKGVIAPGLKVLLTWSAPTKDENNSFVGARIVRKIGSAPINVNDGTVVYEGTKLNYTDTDLIEGTTYYYRAFAYNIKTAYQTAMRVVRIVARSISTVLNENAWDTIRSISDAGQGENYWAVGDCKEIILNGSIGDGLTLSNYKVCVFILGFNHNAELEGENRIHFQLGKTALTGGKDICLCDSKHGSSASDGNYFCMNHTPVTNKGGWQSSMMRTKIIGTSLTSYSGTFIGALPAELREVLKPVTKYTDNTGGEGSSNKPMTATIEYAFLLSYYELYGANNAYVSNTEQNKQMYYEYYSAGNDRSKYRHSSTNYVAGDEWWLRSPAYPNGSRFYYFMAVNSNGQSSYYTSQESWGIAPCFCV